MKRGDDDYLIIKKIEPYASKCLPNLSKTFGDLFQEDVVDQGTIIQVLDKNIKTMKLALATMSIYQEEPEHRLMRETVLADHKDPKVPVVCETNVLDFGYLFIEEVEQLKTKEP